MPAFLAPLAVAGISSLLGSLGGNRQRQTQSQSSTQNQTGSSTGRQTGTVSDFQFQQGTENPLLQPARTQGLSSILGLLEGAQGPVFGDNEIAGFLNQVNDLYSTALGNTTSQLASIGALDSGRTATQFGQAGNERASQIGNFFMQLPFQERQAQIDRQLPILNQLLGFVGEGPRGQFSQSTREVDMTEQTDSRQTSTGTTTGNTTSQGPGFGSRLAQNFGNLGLGVAGMGINAGGFGNLFGNQQPAANNNWIWGG